MLPTNAGSNVLRRQLRGKSANLGRKERLFISALAKKVVNEVEEADP
jgi:hypothetical protein